MQDDSPEESLSRFGVWREGLRQRPHAYRLYRLGVSLLGGAIVIGGLALVPLPGPGWLIVFLGLAILASEFVWARRLERFVRAKVYAWSAWVLRQNLAVRGLLGLVAAGSLGVTVYLGLLYYGVPGFVPQQWWDWAPGLTRA